MNKDFQDVLIIQDPLIQGDIICVLANQWSSQNDRENKWYRKIKRKDDCFVKEENKCVQIRKVEVSDLVELGGFREQTA